MKTNAHWLAWAGLVALAAYIIACGPAFSPDGSQVLVPVLKPDSGSSVLRVERYGLLTKKRETLYLEAIPANNKGTAPNVSWTPDGREAVVLLGEGETLRVTVLPLGANRPIRVWRVAVGEGEGNSTLLVDPPPIVGNHLFLGGENLFRLDLANGEVLRRPLGAQGEVVRLIKHPAGILYVLGKTNGTAEIGRLDPEKLSFTPAYELALDFGVGQQKFGAFFAPSADGSRLALSNTDEKEQTAVLIFKGAKLAQRLPVGPTNAPMILGNLIWSRDEKSILAPVFREAAPPVSGATPAGPGQSPVAARKGTRVALMEIPSDGGAVRETPLFEMVEGDQDTLPLIVQISLSPDGKTVAVANTVAVGEDELPGWIPALYLVDLTAVPRGVTRVPMGPGETVASP